MSARWDEALRVAVRGMGLSPRDFWRLSVREWRVLTGDGAKALGIAELEALMAAYPDGCATAPCDLRLPPSGEVGLRPEGGLERSAAIAGESCAPRRALPPSAPSGHLPPHRDREERSLGEGEDGGFL